MARAFAIVVCFPVRLVAAALCTLTLAACGGGGGGGGAGGGGSNDDAQPPLAGPQYVVSGPSPLTAGCDGVPAVGTVYVNAEVEPYVAVNPRNPSNLVGVWQQDRWSNGGARALLTGYSLDGGKTWAAAVAALSRCAGGNAVNGADYARVSDPWVSFAPDGTAYQIALAFNGATLMPGSSSAALVSRSTDGGRTWGPAVTLQHDGADHFNDKESLTADRTDPRYVYAVWDRLAPDNTAPTWLARTTDGGVTWEPARLIYDPGPNASTLNNQIVVLPDGTLVLFLTRFTNVSGPTTAALVVLRSLDKGLTWSAPITVAAVQAIGTVDAASSRTLRDAAFLGSIATGAQGDLAIAWQDARFTQGARDAIAFARSTDGGLTWSAPARINADAGVPAFVPGVAIGGDGTIAVAYYDFRSNTPDAATILTDNWITRSTDGGTTWREARLAATFDLALAPNANGLFLGDYQGLAAIGNAFVPFYAVANSGDSGNRTDIVASLVAPLAAAVTAKAAVPETATRAVVADELPLTPSLASALHASAQRTLARRRVGL